MTEISMDKQYQTRDGREVRILCTDGPDHRYPVCGFIDGAFIQWTPEGRISADTSTKRLGDLVEVPEEITVERWMNVYDEHTLDAACLHETKDEADGHAGNSRIACVPIKITFKKGEGLDG